MYTGPIAQHAPEVGDLSFAELGLPESILRRLQAIGFEHPTAIQAAMIPLALEGDDVVGLAQTGSGKTAAFSLPVIARILDRGGQAVILSPTREIAQQTQAFLAALQVPGIRSVCVIGGVKMGPQVNALGRDPEVIVATPGRLLDHIERRTADVRRVNALVLDEADHMLDLGFLPQVQRVVSALPGRKQTLLFSATMPEPIERLARRYLHEPKRVDILPSTRAAEGLEHQLYMVEESDKRRCVQSILSRSTGSTLVFTRRKIDAEWLCKVLEKEGHPVERIHSDRSQGRRRRALDEFRSGRHRILVATDVAARGLDIPTIEHVVNFDLPDSVEDYIHRSGRTARGANSGLVSSIGTWRDRPLITAIENALGQPLERKEAEGVPAYREIVRKRRKSPLRR